MLPNHRYEAKGLPDGKAGLGKELAVYIDLQRVVSCNGSLTGLCRKRDLAGVTAAVPNIVPRERFGDVVDDIPIRIAQNVQERYLVR